MRFDGDGMNRCEPLLGAILEQVMFSAFDIELEKIDAVHTEPLHESRDGRRHDWSIAGVPAYPIGPRTIRIVGDVNRSVARPERLPERNDPPFVRHIQKENLEIRCGGLEGNDRRVRVARREP